MVVRALDGWRNERSEEGRRDVKLRRRDLGWVGVCTGESEGGGLQSEALAIVRFGAAEAKEFGSSGAAAGNSRTKDRR